MAVASYYDNVLEGRFPRHARAVPLADHDALLDLEFSEAGRDPRFLPGWYILPAVLGGVLMLAALIL
jgi:hypothetical protein